MEGERGQKKTRFFLEPILIQSEQKRVHLVLTQVQWLSLLKINAEDT